MKSGVAAKTNPIALFWLFVFVGSLLLTIYVMANPGGAPNQFAVARDQTVVAARSAVLSSAAPSTQIIVVDPYRALQLTQAATPVRANLITSVPRATATPTATINVWATEYAQAEQTRAAFFSNRGVLPPAVDCSAGLCTPATVPAATLPPSPTRIWYNTLEPDVTPAFVQTREMDMTLQPLMQAMRATATAQANAATRGAQERSVLAERRAPQAERNEQRERIP